MAKNKFLKKISKKTPNLSRQFCRNNFQYFFKVLLLNMCKVLFFVLIQCPWRGFIPWLLTDSTSVSWKHTIQCYPCVKNVNPIQCSFCISSEIHFRKLIVGNVFWKRERSIYARFLPQIPSKISFAAFFEKKIFRSPRGPKGYARPLETQPAFGAYDCWFLGELRARSELIFVTYAH